MIIRSHLNQYGPKSSAKTPSESLAGVAEMALRIGVLLRGGMDFGELYHQDGVVFGEALVRAYNLEKSARVPRVLVSDSIIAKLSHMRPCCCPLNTGHGL